MKEIRDYFFITVTEDKMKAIIHCTDAYTSKVGNLDEQEIIQFIKDHQINNGIDVEVVQRLMLGMDTSEFPLLIAKGSAPVHGEDGKVEPTFHLKININGDNNGDFRDIMKIPSVKEGDKLATHELPTKGTNGKNIYGETVNARAGRPAQLQAGKNVVYSNNDTSFYATSPGQISITEQKLYVYDMYEVKMSLSMEIGNINYEGSVFLSEGLAGLKTGSIKAGHNIYIGYVNQGNLEAHNDIFVENSIIHSECIAKRSLYSQQGNIIGGSLTVGHRVQAKDIGNRLDTETYVNFAFDDEISNKKEALLEKKKELKVTLKKLRKIGAKLDVQSNKKDVKMRITMLKHRNSEVKFIEELQLIRDQLSKAHLHINAEEKAKLIVEENIYPNVIISFGKYQYRVDTIQHHVQLMLKNNEILIQDI